MTRLEVVAALWGLCTAYLVVCEVSYRRLLRRQARRREANRPLANHYWDGGIR